MNDSLTPAIPQDLTSLWETVLSTLQKSVSRGNYIALLKPTALVSLDNNIATVSAPAPMLVDMLRKRFAVDIKTQLDAVTKQDNQVLFVVKTAPTRVKDTPLQNAPLFQEGSLPPPIPLSIGHLPRVRPEYTFPNFAVSSSNQLAFTASMTVASHIGTAYNPLFLYGPVGVGKTHLMNAVANDVYQKSPDKKIIYLTSEEFTNEVIEAIGTNTTAKMKRKFRTAYLLIIDDVQFFEGKEKVQEELFHTFNILIDNGSQIILSSDRPPQEIKKLEKRLSSRFAGGLTVDIEKPDFELKTAILQKKAEKYGQVLPITVAKLIAEAATDTRSLEGLLLRVITQATFLQSEITEDVALKALGGITEEKHDRLHSDDVIQAVCDFYRVKPTQLKGPKRDASLVRARQVAMFLLKSELQLTLVEIGNLLGGRDHTTVMHGVEKIEHLVENQGGVVSEIRGITKSLKG
jgi:chromosomal replication initiator protein